MYLAWTGHVLPGVSSAVPRWRAALLFSFLVALAACGSSRATSTTSTNAGASDVSIAFDQSGVVTAATAQTIALSLHVQGSSDPVSLALDGDYGDASLSASTVATNAGAASITLHTSSSPSTFNVIAHIGSAQAELAIAVSASGFATVQVLANYAGVRDSASVVSSAFVGTSCAALAKLAPSDGALVATGALAAVIPLTNVPAGAHLSITARLGHYASGCADVDALVSGATANAVVTIYDRPMALDMTNLDAQFTYAPTETNDDDWTSMLDTAVIHVTGTFLGDDESSALLDQMNAACAPSDAALFATSRNTLGWDATVSTFLAARPSTLHASVSAWMTAAEPSARGELDLHLGASPQTGTVAVTLGTFGLYSAAEVGLTANSLFDWVADAKDDVHLGGTFSLASTTLIARAADSQAEANEVGATNVASALALVADCDGLGAALAGGGTSYGACDANCTADLCRTALAAAWSGAITNSSTYFEATQIAFTASAPATVNDVAAPSSFKAGGQWLGKVVAPTGNFELQGAATASAPTH